MHGEILLAVTKSGENSDSRGSPYPARSQACGRKATPMCEAKLPPSGMATAPSVAAADDVRGPLEARMEA
jgi:hypothetical protein